MYGISNVSKHKAWKFSLVSERELFFPFFAGMFIRYRFISRHLCNVLLWRCLLCCPWFLWPSASTPRIIFFLNLRIQTCMLLCHSSVFLIWKGVKHVAHDLESSQAAAFSLELDSGVLRKCTLHCSAVARYPDWDTWASPVQTYISLPPSGEIMPLSLNLLCIAEDLLTPTWSSHICVSPCMGRREEGGKWTVGRRKWGCSKALEAAGSQLEAALETKRWSCLA